MTIREDLWVSWLTAKGRPKHVLIMLVIPFIGVSAILGSLVLTDYIKGRSNQEFLRLGADVIVGVTDEEESSPRLSIERLAALTAIDGVKSVVSLAVVSQVPGVSPRVPGLPPTLRTPTLAVSGDLFETLGAELAAGRFLESQDRGLPIVVVGASLADIMGVGPGDTIFLDEELFVAVGIFHMGSALRDLNNSILITPESATELFGSEEGFTRVAVKAEPDRVDQVARLIPVALNLGGAPEVSVIVERGLLAGQQVAGESVLSLGLGVGFLTLIFGALVIGVSMRSSVVLRSREIGIRAALGHLPASIARQFVIEAVGTALIGGLLAAMIALGVSEAVLRATGISSSVGLRVAIGAVVLAVVVSTFSSLVAVRAATLIDPATAIRTA
ncbi:ABC transporter permease [soil metagenome]